MVVTSPRASATAYRSVPVSWPEDDLPRWIQRIAEVVAKIMDGKINATGTLTLAINTTTTTITDARIGPESKILISPTTANAAGAIATTYFTVGDQTATVTHANNSQADRTFGYVVIG